MQTIKSKKIPNLQKAIKTFIRRHLIQESYAKTLAEFDKSQHEETTEHYFIKERQEIQKLIISGEIDLAITKIFKILPSFFTNNFIADFEIKCYKFYEKVLSQELHLAIGYGQSELSVLYQKLEDNDL